MLPILVIAVVFTAYAYHRGLAKEGLVAGGKLLLQVGPVLIPAFMMAGMAAVLVPTELLAKWLGASAGLRGLLIGTAAGALMPGGPFVLFPILAVALHGGVSAGVTVSFLSSWALLGIHRIAAFEVPIMGWRFTLIRVAASAAFPIVMGALADLLYSRTAGGS